MSVIKESRNKLREEIELKLELDVLKERHAKLEAKLTKENKRKFPREQEIKQIKLEKLRNKDEQERIKHLLAPEVPPPEVDQVEAEFFVVKDTDRGHEEIFVGRTGDDLEEVRVAMAAAST
jgi:hypothetical protein